MSTSLTAKIELCINPRHSTWTYPDIFLLPKLATTLTLIVITILGVFIVLSPKYTSLDVFYRDRESERAGGRGRETEPLSVHCQCRALELRNHGIMTETMN